MNSVSIPISSLDMNKVLDNVSSHLDALAKLINENEISFSADLKGHSNKNNEFIIRTQTNDLLQQSIIDLAILLRLIGNGCEEIDLSIIRMEKTRELLQMTKTDSEVEPGVLNIL